MNVRCGEIHKFFEELARVFPFKVLYVTNLLAEGWPLESAHIQQFV